MRFLENTPSLCCEQPTDPAFTRISLKDEVWTNKYERGINYKGLEVNWFLAGR